MFRRNSRTAFSLIEVMVTMTILGILLAFASPSVTRSVEQSHADLAGASLRSISSAQRFFWLENRTYASDLNDLITAELVDQELLNSARYEFSIVSADDEAFVARARRRSFNDAGNAVYNGAWSGEFDIDETGEITGDVEGPYSTMLGGRPQLEPGF
ncbi:MAG: prepilin-type N-terminal cleavage/methylation domain-containing protein [Planctomycetota bacterium]